MKRSEMVLNIASELICELTDFISFDKAQKMAEIILNRIEKEGMKPPFSIFGEIGRQYKKDEWEPEND